MKSLVLGMVATSCLYCQVPTEQSPYEKSINKRREEIAMLYRLNDYNKYYDNTVKIESQVHTNILGVPQLLHHYGTAYNFHDNADKSYYFTAYHCVNEGDTFIVHNIKGEEFKANIEEIFPESDFAIISTKKDDYKAVHIEMFDLNDIVLGEDVFIPGYPGGNYRTLKRSNISTIVFNSNNDKMIGIDELVIQGYSGSPVFIERGERLGLIGFMDKFDPTSLNGMVIPSYYFKKIIERYEQK